MRLAVQQRTRHGQLECVAAVADACGQQIGTELGRDGPDEYGPALFQGDDAVAQRRVARDNPAGDFLVRYLVEVTTERGVARIWRGIKDERGTWYGRAGISTAQMQEVLSVRQQPRLEVDAEGMAAIADTCGD